MMEYDIPDRLQAVTGRVLRPGGLALTDRAVSYCRFSKGDRIVDVGCGFGITLSHMNTAHGFQACGIDRSIRMLSEIRNLPVMQAAADGLPFADSVFAGVFCECVLSLLPEPETALRELARVLRPAGYLVISDIYLRNPGSETPPEFSPLIFSMGHPPPPSCLSGAVGKNRWCNRVKDCGLDLLLWEDHSGFLKEMAARIVWELGSQDALMRIFFPGSCAAGKNAVRSARPGYFLMIARKTEPQGILGAGRG